MNMPRAPHADGRPTPTSALSLDELLTFPGGLDGTPYTPLDRLGWGMWTEVLACDGPAAEDVVVKVVRPGCVLPEEAAVRLRQEAALLARVDHPSVVAVHDTGETEDGRPYFVMPRLFGETALGRLRRRGCPLRPGRAVRVLMDVLDGLAALHAAGIIHRDVKPSNVFHADAVDARGRRSERAVLLDLSVAHGGEDDPSWSAGSVVGTPRYLAPEQIRAEAVDGRTDVYAAGLLAFELMAGRGPFDAVSTRSLFVAHLEAEPHPLSDFAEVSPGLEAVIATALEKRPERRFPSAGAFRTALLGAAGIDPRPRPTEEPAYVLGSLRGAFLRGAA